MNSDHYFFLVSKSLDSVKERGSHEAFTLSTVNFPQPPQKSLPARPGCRAEGLRRHTPGGKGSCLFRRRLAATPKRRQRLSADRGHLPKWRPTRRAGRSASLCRAIPNVFARQKHPAQKKQIARLHRFHIRAERLRRRWKLDAKFFQPLFGAGRARAFAGYHLPMCAPPSTCSTSPVIWRASVR